MKKVILGLLFAVVCLGGYATVAQSQSIHIGLPGVSVHLPSVYIGPPVVYERRYYQRHYVRRRVVRQQVYTQSAADSNVVVEGQIPPPPPDVTLSPPPAMPAAEAITVEQGASVWLRTDIKCCYVFYESKWNWNQDAWYYHRYHGHYNERSAEWWVQYGFDETYWKQYDQPVVQVETWYQTNAVCCYVYFENKWNWNRDHWYHHHYRGHYFERSPQYWARSSFDEGYWRRYEYGRRFHREERRWVVEGRLHASHPYVQERGQRIYIQPHEPRFQQHFDRGRHHGWERQRGWERQEFSQRVFAPREHHEYHGHGGFDKHDRHGDGDGHGHDHGRGHGGGEGHGGGHGHGHGKH